MYVVGVRPNSMKVAPVISAAARWNAQPDFGVQVDALAISRCA